MAAFRPSELTKPGATTDPTTGASHPRCDVEPGPALARGRLLFTPTPEASRASRMTAFARFVRAHGAGLDAGLELGSHVTPGRAEYERLHAWSVAQPGHFWRSVGQFFGVHALDRANREMSSTQMPGVHWFEGAELNYVDYALQHCDEDLALVYRDETARRITLTYGQLRAAVAQLAAHLASRGVAHGDRVVGLLPNCPEAVVGLLATASLGAIWSCCPPEFGVASVLDRFEQIEPKVLLAVENYVYGGKAFDKREAIAAIIAGLPSLQFSVTAPGPAMGFAQAASTPSCSLAPRPVAFDHPLWILYSSGTTGKPKAIVHSHGGILLEHLKVLGLHSDLDRHSGFFWFTTTGWMMWNYLVGGLLVGARVVLYDGSPTFPDLRTLWRLAEQEQVVLFGVGAPFLMACRAGGVSPGKEFELSQLRTLGSTGAPLPPEGFDYVAQHVGFHIALHSVSGGTDLCTAFLLGAPWLPVRAGELSCAALGADVVALNEQAQPVVGETGELVLRQPMPSMPVMFWNDPGGVRLRGSYFEDYPGLWRHGDWIVHFSDGAYVVLGRSDSTLNRGGVRMGTSEFYRALDDVAQVSDSLVADTSTPGGEGELWLFVVLAAGRLLDAPLERTIKHELKQRLSPRHVPDRIVQVAEIPYTLSGKKLEVPVKRLLMGAKSSDVAVPGTLRNPQALDAIAELVPSR